MLTAHSRKILEKFIKAIAFLEVVHQGLDRNTCPGEDDRSAHYVRGSSYQGVRKVHVKSSLAREWPARNGLLGTSDVAIRDSGTVYYLSPLYTLVIAIKFVEETPAGTAALLSKNT